MLNAAWITALSSLVVAVIALLGLLTRWAWRIASRTTRFLDDFFGEPSRDGFPGRLGVMARLQALERTLAEVRAETKPNGGTSMRDVVHRTARDVTEVKGQVTALASEVAQIKRRQREDRDA